MGRSKMSAVSLLVLGILVVLFAVANALIEWEWWDFLLVLSSMAFVLGLVLLLAQGILRRLRAGD